MAARQAHTPRRSAGAVKARGVEEAQQRGVRTVVLQRGVEKRHERFTLKWYTLHAHLADEVDDRGAAVAAVHARRVNECLQKHAVLIAHTQSVENLPQPWVVSGLHELQARPPDQGHGDNRSSAHAHFDETDQNFPGGRVECLNQNLLLQDGKRALLFK